MQAMPIPEAENQGNQGMVKSPRPVATQQTPDVKKKFFKW